MTMYVENKMRFYLLAIGLIVPVVAWNGEVTIPNEFVAGEKAIAADVNENFNVLANEVNDNNLRINNNETSVASTTNALSGKQSRVAGTCNAGSSIRVINDDGSVICEADDVGTSSGGDITAVNTAAGSGLTGGVVTGEVNLVVDTNIIQQKLSGAVCAGTEYVKSIAPNGTTVCSTPSSSSGDITSINTTTGSGLQGGVMSGDANLSVDTTTIQKRVSNTCLAGSSIRVINQDGTVICETDDAGSGDITAVNPGSGLTGGGDAGPVTLNVDTTTIQAVVQGNCPTGESAVRAIDTSGNVICQPVSNIGSVGACGGFFGCASTTSGDTSTITIRTVSVDANGSSGRIMVFFNSYIWCDASENGQSIDVIAQIVDSSTADPNALNDGGMNVRSRTVDALSYSYPMSMTRSFAVTSLGVKTYYVNARNAGTSAIGCSFYVGNMDAIYIP